MSITPAIPPARKTLQQKQLEASEAAAKRTVQSSVTEKRVEKKPIFHPHFGPYLFWMTTGQRAAGTPAQPVDYFGESPTQAGTQRVIDWLATQVENSTDRLSFNPYRYLLTLLRREARKVRYASPSLVDLYSWLNQQITRAEAYAALFTPAQYNVRTTATTNLLAEQLSKPEARLHEPLDSGKGDGPEHERLAYYQLQEQRHGYLWRRYERLSYRLDDQKHDPTQQEQALLTHLQTQLDVLTLGEGARLDRSRLQTRHNRHDPHQHEQYRRGLEAAMLTTLPGDSKYAIGSFQLKPDTNTGKIPPRDYYNITLLIEEYDACSKTQTTPERRRAYANKVKATLAEKQTHIIKLFNPYDELDSIRANILADVAGLLVDRFSHHIDQSLLAPPRQPMASPPAIARFSPSQQTPATPIGAADASPTGQSADMPSSLADDLNSLLIHPFKVEHLTSLLQRLEVLDAKGNCLTNGLKGAGAGKKGRFTAAYRVLQREGLMGSTVKDSVWAAAFKAEYGAELKEKAINHVLTSSGKASNNSTKPFREGVEIVYKWLIEWREK